MKVERFSKVCFMFITLLTIAQKTAVCMEQQTETEREIYGLMDQVQDKDSYNTLMVNIHKSLEIPGWLSIVGKPKWTIASLTNLSGVLTKHPDLATYQNINFKIPAYFGWNKFETSLKDYRLSLKSFIEYCKKNKETAVNNENFIIESFENFFAKRNKKLFQLLTKLGDKTFNEEDLEEFKEDFKQNKYSAHRVLHNIFQKLIVNQTDTLILHNIKRLLKETPLYNTKNYNIEELSTKEYADALDDFLEKESGLTIEGDLSQLAKSVMLKKIQQAKEKQEEAARKKEEERIRKEQEEAAHKKEEERIRKEQEEAARKKEEERIRKEQEEAARKKEEKRIRKEQEEAARKKEEERIRKEQEEAARKKAEAAGESEIEDLSINLNLLKVKLGKTAASLETLKSEIVEDETTDEESAVSQALHELRQEEAARKNAEEIKKQQQRLLQEQQETEAAALKLQQLEEQKRLLEKQKAEAEAERIRKEKEEADRKKAEAAAEAERIRKEKEEADRKKAEAAAEAERIRKEKEEADRKKAEAAAEAERIRKEKEEADRKKAEAAAEAERIRKEKEEADRKKAEAAAEAERIRKEKEEADRKKAEASRKPTKPQTSPFASKLAATLRMGPPASRPKPIPKPDDRSAKPTLLESPVKTRPLGAPGRRRPTMRKRKSKKS